MINVYVWKGPHAWELTLGETAEQPAESMNKYFIYANIEATEMELYDEIEESRSYYYGAVDPRNEKDITYPDPDVFKYTYGFQHPEIIAYKKQLAEEQD